jgi:hypothetical protein
MRGLMLAVPLAMGLVLPPLPAHAYAGGWCAVVNVGFGTVQERCGFASFQACSREASFHGPSSFCRPSQYAWPVEEGPRRAKHRRRGHRHR